MAPKSRHAAKPGSVPSEKPNEAAYRWLSEPRWVLWEGGTIADAAHAADFADAAHLTRTFYQMVGMAPSVLMRGQFAEIPSPFNTPPTE